MKVKLNFLMHHLAGNLVLVALPFCGNPYVSNVFGRINPMSGIAVEWGGGGKIGFCLSRGGKKYKFMHMNELLMV